MALGDWKLMMKPTAYKGSGETATSIFSGVPSAFQLRRNRQRTSNYLHFNYLHFNCAEIGKGLQLSPVLPEPPYL